jgi:tight adherence protein C
MFVPGSEKARHQDSSRLMLAGIRGRNALARYLFIRVMLMVFLPLATFMLVTLYPELRIKDSTLLPVIMAFGVGMILPSYLLDKKVASRQRLIRNALPDVLDMLVVCTEAGLGLNAALLRVTQELNDIHPEFASELMLVNSQIRTGVDRETALRGLVDRTGLDDVKGLIMMITQSMRFGTGIASTLRLYADEFRDKRTQRAEEVAATLATKMIFPLMFCFMPAFFVVALGPSILVLKKMLG